MLFNEFVVGSLLKLGPENPTVFLFNSLIYISGSLNLKLSRFVNTPLSFCLGRQPFNNLQLILSLHILLINYFLYHIHLRSYNSDNYYNSPSNILSCKPRFRKMYAQILLEKYSKAE